MRMLASAVMPATAVIMLLFHSVSLTVFEMTVGRWNILV